MLEIIIAEDHAITRAGLRTVIEDAKAGRVVGETGDGLEAIRMIETEHPDVLVLDLSMPGLNGLDVLRQVRRRSPATNVIVLSMHGDDEYVVRALREGAAGYVLKGSDAQELIQAIESTASGVTYLGSGLPESLREGVDAAGPIEDRYSTLTDREREVTQLIAEGYTSQEIGERLYISRRTVDKHRERIMAKLELNKQAELVRYALKRGIIPGDRSSPAMDS